MRIHCTARPIVTAHAGCIGTAMDSLDSVIAGMRMGADVVEVDVRFLGDGTPVLSHEPFPESRAGALVPLESVVRLILPHRRVALNIDVREPRRARGLTAVVAPLLASRRVFATGLSPRDIDAFANACPDIPYAVDLGWRDVRFGGRGELRAVARRIRGLGALALNLDYRFITRRLLDACAEEGCLVYVWTVDSMGAMLRMIDWGAASITTKRVDVLRILVENEADVGMLA